METERTRIELVKDVTGFAELAGATSLLPRTGTLWRPPFYHVGVRLDDRRVVGGFTFALGDG